jgi:hypothetical protein
MQCFHLDRWQWKKTVHSVAAGCQVGGNECHTGVELGWGCDRLEVDHSIHRHDWPTSLSVWAGMHYEAALTLAVQLVNV